MSKSQRESNAGATMIHTTKATHGIIITIDNYSVYQEIQNYEGNGEGNGETLAKPQREAHGTFTNPDNKETRDYDVTLNQIGGGRQNVDQNRLNARR
jgi:hypothetical protein